MPGTLQTKRVKITDKDVLSKSLIGQSINRSLGVLGASGLIDLAGHQKRVKCSTQTGDVSRAGALIRLPTETNAPRHGPPIQRRAEHPSIHSGDVQDKGLGRLGGGCERAINAPPGTIFQRRLITANCQYLPVLRGLRSTSSWVPEATGHSTRLAREAKCPRSLGIHCTFALPKCRKRSLYAADCFPQEYRIRLW